MTGWIMLSLLCGLVIGCLITYSIALRRGLRLGVKLTLGSINKELARMELQRLRTSQPVGSIGIGTKDDLC